MYGTAFDMKAAASPSFTAILLVTARMLKVYTQYGSLSVILGRTAKIMCVTSALSRPNKHSTRQLQLSIDDSFGCV